MRFARIHGLGNDYLLLESGEGLTPALVRAICHRHTGLGSDGILEPVEPRLGARCGHRPVWEDPTPLGIHGVLVVLDGLRAEAA